MIKELRFWCCPSSDEELLLEDPASLGLSEAADPKLFLCGPHLNSAAS